MPQDDEKNIKDMERELAEMLAKLFAQENEAGHLLFTFTNADVPILRRAKAIEVEVRWSRDRAEVFPEFSLAGVVGYEIG